MKEIGDKFVEEFNDKLLEFKGSVDIFREFSENISKMMKKKPLDVRTISEGEQVIALN